ncbi:MAG: hypothetical protein WA005_06330 [Candidatus Binataceae bacterium]
MMLKEMDPEIIGAASIFVRATHPRIEVFGLIGYTRVSTAGHADGGISLDR